MDAIASCAERTLQRSAHPTLRLSELLEHVSEALDRTLDLARLRAILEAHPERFRILEPWRGRWVAVDGAAPPRSLGGEAWVVAVGDPDGPPDDGGPAATKLRESVRWLARGVDPRSSSEVSRWYAIALAERAARRALARKAA